MRGDTRGGPERAVMRAAGVLLASASFTCAGVVDRAAAQAPTCPTPGGQPGVAAHPPPSPGDPLAAFGTPDMRITVVGPGAGFGCVGETTTLTLLVENVGTGATANARIGVTQRGSLALGLSTRGVLIDGALPVPACVANEVFVGCRLGAAFAPGEQRYIDVAVAPASTGTAELNLHASSDFRDADDTNDMIDIRFPVGAPPPPPLPATTLRRPELRYTDFRFPPPRPGQRSCRSSQFVLRTAVGKPVAHNVVMRVGPSRRILLRSGPTTLTRVRTLPRANTGIAAYSGLRACTIGRRPAVTFLGVSADNAPRVDWRISFNPVTNRWRITRAKSGAAGNAPTPPGSGSGVGGAGR